MDENQICQGIADTLTDKPLYEVTIAIKEPKKPQKLTLWERLQRKQPIEPELARTLVVRPCVVGNMKRIAGRSAMLPTSVLDVSLAQVVLPMIAEHLDNVIYIIAAGIQNTKREPDADLIEFLQDNCDNYDLYQLLAPVLEQVAMQSFLNTIALAKGSVRILKPASPIDGSELIASHTQG